MTLRRVTIDLTPLLPGGDNGGAKQVALSLVQQFGALAPETEFTLMTSAVSHDELAQLESAKVRRHCVDADIAPSNIDSGALGGARTAARLLVNTLVPTNARSKVKDSVWTLIKRQRRAQVSRSLLADVHFAPFTAPFFFDKRVPLVALVHDVQFLDYPDWFDEQTRASRELHFRDACDKADLLVCVSDFVRRSVLANSQRAPETVTTIYSTVLHATAPDSNASTTARRVLDRVGLRSSRYLLYPANAWPHKNHRRLIEGFALHLRGHSDSDLSIVCTGAPSAGFEDLARLAADSLPPGAFAFTGYLDEPEFAAVLRTSRAVIFPSLYEGFGLPVLEAMSCDRPVLCSDAGSLPEVVGDAAIMFDPRDPSCIAHAVEQLENDPDLENRLVQRGRNRLKQFGSARDLAARYLAVFEEVRSRRAAR